MAVRKPKTFYFGNYPLREKIAKANFTLKLKNGGNSLRYTPDQFGRGLQRSINEMVRDMTNGVMETFRMQEIRTLSDEDRKAHFDWILETAMQEVVKRKDNILSLVTKFD